MGNLVTPVISIASAGEHGATQAGTPWSASIKYGDTHELV
jgi:hypothetical protein